MALKQAQESKKIALLVLLSILLPSVVFSGWTLSSNQVPQRWHLRGANRATKPLLEHNIHSLNDPSSLSENRKALPGAVRSLTARKAGTVGESAAEEPTKGNAVEANSTQAMGGAGGEDGEDDDCDEEGPVALKPEAADTPALATDSPAPNATSGKSSPIGLPWGCKLGWGTNADMVGSHLQDLDFVTYWIGWESGCGICDEVKANAAKNIGTVLYMYFIGFLTNEDGLGDCNVDKDEENLCTKATQWIRDNRERVISSYGEYAAFMEKASSIPVVYLLEGDFIQYTYETQVNAFTMAELGQLARDIVKAIKDSDPDAIVAINHSTWMHNEQAESFYDAMPMGDLDMVWTTAPGNNDGFLDATTNPSSYNAATSTFEWVSEKSGKQLIVDTSFGASLQEDSWTGIPDSVLNTRISEGVAGLVVTQPPADYGKRIKAKANLDPTC